ncbi:putative nitrous oxide N-terminal [Rosellinia necatrix]|uniref:Putative nitrous oxide N-terminal n=1 Tax=Rosellinia necatrix TaxID=77044 RepID=A0A1W2THE6_ROSNE|nr:putative nitrous oxide N-terminal [Rosellinia necatrix]
MPLLSLVIPALLGLPAHVLGVNLLASHYTGKIYSLSFNNGTLKVGPSVAGAGSLPAWLGLDTSSDGAKTVYSVDEDWFGSGVLASFAVGADGTLTQTGRLASLGASVHGTPYADSKFFATVEYDPSTLTTYALPFRAGGKVLQKFKFNMTAPGPHPRQNAPHPHAAHVDPTGRFLLVPDLGADLVRVFGIDATSGQLTACPPGEASPGDGPRHGAFWAPAGGNSTDGLMLYTVNELGNSVTSWATSYPAAGAGGAGCLSLQRRQTLPTYAGGALAAGSKAAEVHVAGDFLYAANRADQTFGARQDSLAAYAIDAASGGRIAWLGAANAHAWFPRTFQVNRAGDLVAVGGQTSSNVAILRRDPATGRLGDLVASVPVATPGREQEEDGLSAVIWVE